MEQNKFYQIKNVTEHEYTLVGCDGSVIIRPIQDVDKSASVFTIQDAKDGDVLAEDSCIFIIQKLGGNSTAAKTYCTLYNDGDFDDGSILYFDVDSTKPATKEQRDKLEKAMADAGYEWDAEKKELRKIELNEWVPKKGDVCKPKKGGNNIFLCDQNGIVFSFVEEMKNGCAGGEISISTLLKDYELVEPKDYNTFDISFNAKDSELQEASYYIPEGFHAEINGNKVIIKKGEQKPQRIISAEAKEALYDKPDWSKDGERIRKELLEFLDGLSKLGKNTTFDRWTKSDCADWICWLEKQGDQKDKGEISDGYHTFNELYYYRMLYNAAFFNLLPKELVHKSKKHHNGEECFGGGWFIVMANLPTGQISNHYELKDWDMFNIPEKEVADEWDGHTPQDAAERLHRYLLEKQGQVKEGLISQHEIETYKENDDSLTNEDEYLRERCMAYMDGTLKAAIEKNDKGEIVELRKILLWLEKQSEQKPAYTDEDDRNFSLIYGVLEMEKADTSSTNYKEEIDHALKWLEKVKRQ